MTEKITITRYLYSRTAAGRITAACCKFAAVVLLTTHIVYAQTEDYSAPSNIVEELHQKLIEIMQNADVLGYQGRFREVAPFISQYFDTPLIVKVILSRYWDNLDDAQKSNFIELFKKLSTATYASRFDSYNGEQFVEISREVLKRNRLLIKTELRRKDKEPVKLDYLMHDTGEHWLIISVIANGVNDLSLKRAEYAAVIKDKGFDDLVAEISEKIRDMENTTNLAEEN